MTRYLVFLSAAIGFTYTYAVFVQSPAVTDIEALHKRVLENTAPSPYQYHMFVIDWIFEIVHDLFGLSLYRVVTISNFLSMIFLLVAVDLWCRTVTGSSMGGIIGALYVVGSSFLMLHFHFYHPADFWGTGLFTLLLWCVTFDKLLGAFVLGVVSGFLWEKAAFAFIAYPAMHWGKRSIWRSALLIGIACVGPQVLIRLWLGPRPDVLAGAGWGELLQSWRVSVLLQFAFLAPAGSVLILRWKQIPRHLKVLTLYLPMLYGVYIAMHGRLKEIRSFWVLMPILAAIVAWGLAVIERGDSLRASQ